MKSLALLIVLLLGTATTIASAKSSKPWFCHDLDCPEYDVIDKNDDYEVREYSKGTKLINAQHLVGSLFTVRRFNDQSISSGKLTGMILQASGLPQRLKAIFTPRPSYKDSRCDSVVPACAYVSNRSNI